jgi:hypothetical protein
METLVMEETKDHVYRNQNGLSIVGKVQTPEDFIIPAKYIQGDVLRAEVTVQECPENQGDVQITQIVSFEIDDTKEEEISTILIKLEKFEAFKKFIVKIDKKIKELKSKLEELNAEQFPMNKVVPLE